MAKTKRKNPRPKREPVNILALNWYCRSIRKDLSTAACGIAVTEFSLASDAVSKEARRLAAAGMKTAASALGNLSKEAGGETLSLINKAKAQASRAHNILKQEGKLNAGQMLNLHKVVRKAKEAAERASGIADEECLTQMSRVR